MKQKLTGHKAEQIVLASASPRRSDLLEKLGFSFEVEPSNVVERPLADETPPDYTMRIARSKAVEVARRREHGLVIGADTVVVLDGKVLGKPSDEQDARRMLQLLSGKWHAVMTGVALYDAATHKEAVDYTKTLVRLAQLSEQEIDWYVATGEPMDKAGGYGIQGLGSLFVDEIAGNYHNVVGLPVPLVYRLARQLGHSLLYEQGPEL
jgi:septum formation protein